MQVTKITGLEDRLQGGRAERLIAGGERAKQISDEVTEVWRVLLEHCYIPAGDLFVS